MTMLIAVACLAMGTTVPLSGTVEDAAGKPVAGAVIWLGDTIANRQGPETLATAKTDDQGRFQLERADDLESRVGYWSPTLWAYKPGSRVAYVEFKRGLPKADEPVRLVLGSPSSTPLQVLQADGKPAKGALVRFVQLNLKVPRPPDKLLDHLAATTDADGRATLDGFAPADVFALDVTAEGQLVQCLALDTDTGTVTLRPLGRLKARIVADDPKALKGWTITATSHLSSTEPGYSGPTAIHWERETTGDDGLIEFPPLAEGLIYWNVKAPEGSEYIAATQSATKLLAGETAEAEFTVRRGIRVEGIIRQEPGGAPIPGVKVDLDPLQSNFASVRELATDAQGRFSAFVPPGTIRFSYSAFSMPKDYFLPPGVQTWADFEVKEGEERHEITPPPLRKAALVRGRVIDEAGKPAAAVGVGGSWISAEFGSNPNSARADTDAQGEFVLGSIAPNAEVRVSASSGLVAVSDTVIVSKAGVGEPITLHLRNRPTLALSGRILGADGQPLADALVQVKIRPPNQPFNTGSEFASEESEEVRTGPDGHYKTPNQLPIDNDYRVEVKAPGYDPAASKWVVSPNVEVPDLTLRRSIGRREVVGRVVDSFGKPVVGAEVFQSGDGPKRTQGTTDADGRFRVPRVADAPAFLFVSKEGYRFLGQRIEAGNRPVDFALRSLAEPPATPLRPVASPIPRDEERAIARDLIAEAQKTPGGPNEVWALRGIPETTALIDPDRVVAMIENQVMTTDPDLLAALAISRSEGDPRKALEFLDAISEPQKASYTALNLFDRLRGAPRPDFRRELLNRAERRGREVQEPGHSASLLFRTADRWLDLGDLDHGSVLVREAQALADKSGQQPLHFSFPIPNPGNDPMLALARVDLPAALKLLEDQAKEPNEQAWLRTEIAKRIAATNPAEARRIFGMIQDQHRSMTARHVVCLRMAAKDLPAARALAAEGHDPMLEALVPAVAAKALAATDPRAARELLFESVERLQKLDLAPSARPALAVVLARLLPLAVRIDPDRAPSYFWLALSRRPPLSPLAETAPVMPEVRQHYLDLAELAALTARYDRAAAEVVFAPVAARLVGLVDETWGLGNEGSTIFRAAGAFDARTAKALVDALPEDPTPPVVQPTNGTGFRHHSKTEAQLALARILGLPAGLRLREPLTPNAGDDWLEELED